MKSFNRKRLLSFLLVFLMVFTILPSNTMLALAAEAEDEQVEVIDISVPSEDETLDEAEEIINNIGEEEVNQVEELAPEAVEANGDEASKATESDPVWLKETGDQSYKYWASPLTGDSKQVSLYYAATNQFNFTAEVYLPAHAETSVSAEATYDKTKANTGIELSVDGVPGASIASSEEAKVSTITGSVNVSNDTGYDFTIALTVGETSYSFHCVALAFVNDDNTVRTHIEEKEGEVIEYKLNSQAASGTPYFLLLGNDSDAISVDPLPKTVADYWAEQHPDLKYGENNKYYIFNNGIKTYPIIRAKKEGSIHVHVNGSVDAEKTVDTDLSATLELDTKGGDVYFGGIVFSSYEELKAFTDGGSNWDDVAEENRFYANSIQNVINNLSKKDKKCIFVSSFIRTSGGTPLVFEDITIPEGVQVLYLNNGWENPESEICNRLSTVTFLSNETEMYCSTLEGYRAPEADEANTIQFYCGTSTADQKPSVYFAGDTNVRNFTTEPVEGTVNILYPAENEEERKPYSYRLYPADKKSLYDRNNFTDAENEANKILVGNADSLNDILKLATKEYGYLRVWTEAWTPGDFEPERLNVPKNIKGINLITHDEISRINVDDKEYMLYHIESWEDPGNREYYVRIASDEDEQDAKYYKVDGNPWVERPNIITDKSYAYDEITLEGVENNEFNFDAESAAFDYKIANITLPDECVLNLEIGSIRGAELEETAKFESATTITTVNGDKAKVLFNTYNHLNSVFVAHGDIEADIDGGLDCDGLLGFETVNITNSYEEDGGAYIKTTKTPLSIQNLGKVDCDVTLCYEAESETFNPDDLIQLNWDKATIASGKKIYFLYERLNEVHEGIQVVKFSGVSGDSANKYPYGTFVYESFAGRFNVNESGCLEAIPVEICIFKSQAKYDKFVDGEDVEPDEFYEASGLQEALSKIKSTDKIWVGLNELSRGVSFKYLDVLTVPANVNGITINPGGYEINYGPDDNRWTDRTLGFKKLVLKNPATKVLLYGGSNAQLNVEWEKKGTTAITGELRLMGDNVQRTDLVMNGGTLYTGDYMEIASIKGPSKTVIEGGLVITKGVGTFMDAAGRNDLGEVVYKSNASLLMVEPSHGLDKLLENAISSLVLKVKSINPFNKDTYETIRIDKENGDYEDYEVYYYKANANVSYKDRFVGYSSGEGDYDFDVFEKSFVKIGSSFYEVNYTFLKDEDHWIPIIKSTASSVKATDIERRKSKLKVTYATTRYDYENNTTAYDWVDLYSKTNILNKDAKAIDIDTKTDWIEAMGLAYVDGDGKLKCHRFIIRDKSNVPEFEYRNPDEITDKDERRAYLIEECKYNRSLEGNEIYIEDLKDLEQATKNFTDFELIAVLGADEAEPEDVTLTIPATAKTVRVSVLNGPEDHGKLNLKTVEFKGSGATLMVENVWRDDNPGTITVKSPANSKNYVEFYDALGDIEKVAEGLETATGSEYASLKAEGGTNVVTFYGANFINNIEGFSQVNIACDAFLHFMKGRTKVELNNLVAYCSDEEWGNILFEGYDVNKLPSITSFAAPDNGRLSLGYYNLKKSGDYSDEENPIVWVDPELILTVTAGSKVINLPEEPSEKLLEELKGNLDVVADKECYTVNEEGKLSPIKFLDNGKELYTEYAFGGDVIAAQNTEVSFVAPATEVANGDKLYLSKDKTIENKISEVEITTDNIATADGVSTVSKQFVLAKNETTRRAYVLYVKKGTTTPIVLGKVNIYVTIGQPKLESITWSGMDVMSDFPATYEDENGEEATVDANYIIKQLPSSVDAVLESKEIVTLDISWAKTSETTIDSGGTKYVFEATADNGSFPADDDLRTKSVNVNVWAAPIAAPVSTNAGKANLASEKITPVVTAPANAQIMYTDDGSDPTESAFAASVTASGTGAVTMPELTKTTTIKMVTLGDPDKLVPDSEVVEFTYYVAETIGALRVETIPNQIYTGAQIKPSVVVYNNKNDQLVLNKDFTIKGYKNNTNAGEATLTIKGKGNYSGEIDVPFTILPAETSSITVNALVSSFVKSDKTVYALISKDNKADLSKVVKSLTFGKKTLVAKKDDKANDYSVEYFRNETKLESTAVEFDQNVAANNNYRIVYTLTGNYTGTIELNVEVSGKKDFSKVSVTGVPKSVTFSPVAAENIIDVSKIAVKDGKDEVKSEVYDTPVVSVDGDIATVTINVKPTDTTYIGSKVVTYKLTKTKLSDKKAFDWSFIEAKSFTGSAIELADSAIKFTYKDAKDVEHKLDGETDTRGTLTKNTHYTVEYTKNVNVGTATVVITAKEDAPITGSVKKTFKINKANLVKVDTDKKVSIDDSVQILVKDELNGAIINAKTAEDRFEAMMQKSLVKPQVIVTFNGATLVQDRDYKVTYTNNKAVTNTSASSVKYGSIKIEGKGNFTGAIDGVKNEIKGLQFVVVPKSLESNQIEVLEESAYIAYSAKSKGYKFNPAVYDNGTKLVLNTDYTVEYSDNNNNNGIIVDSVSKLPLESKDVEIIIKGKGNYTGEIGSSFRIVPQTFDKLNFTVAPQVYVKDAPSKISKADVTIKLNAKAKGKILGNDDFEIVSYTNNAKVGTAKATLVSNNYNFPGTKVVTFKIVKGTMADLDITLPASVEYSKAGAKPVVTVMDGGQVLVLNKDYSVKYSNNAAVAAADATKLVKGKPVSIAPTVTITGKGAYSGSATRTFAITKCDLAAAIEAGNVSCQINPVAWVSATKDVAAAPVLKQDGKALAMTSIKKVGDYKLEYVDSTKIASMPKDKLDTTVIVKITPEANGNYTGAAIVKNLFVVPVLPTKMTVAAAAKAYDGEAVKLNLSDINVSYTVKVSGKSEKVEIPAASLSTYFVIDDNSYVNNNKVGNAKVTLLGKEGTAFEGYKKVITFKITAYNNKPVTP